MVSINVSLKDSITSVSLTDVLTNTGKIPLTNFLSFVKTHDGNTTVELIVGTKKLLTVVHAIGYKSGLNIEKVLQDRFRESGIPLNISSENAQE